MTLFKARTRIPSTSAPVVSATSTEIDGVTFSFWDAPTGGSAVSVPLAADCFGNLHVVSSELAATVYLQTDVAYGTDAAGYRYNGLAKTYFSKFNETQPFDESLTEGASGLTSNLLPYDHASNLHPDATGVRPAIAPGEAASWTQWKRRTDITMVDPSPFWQTAEAQATLSILPARPRFGFITPCPSDPDQTVYGTDADIDWSVFPDLEPVSGQPVDVGSERMIRTVPGYGSIGGDLRRLGMDVVPGNDSANYSGGIGRVRAIEALRLVTAAGSPDRREALLRLIRHGLWRYAEWKVWNPVNGFEFRAGAGQHCGYMPGIVFAGFALQNATILSDALSIKTNMTEQNFWIDESLVGRPFYWFSRVNTDTAAERRNRTFFPSDVGLPWLSQQVDPFSRANSNDMRQRYMESTADTNFLETMAIAVLRNGPAGFSTGLDWILGGSGAAKDATNPRAAIFAFQDRLYEANFPWQVSTGALPSWALTWYETYRGDIDFPVPQNPPEHNPAQTAAVTAATGGFSYDFSAITLSRYSITRRDIRWSYDGLEWVQLDDVAASGSVTGLVRGAQVYVQERRWNAYGASPWSDNYSVGNKSTDYPERYTITTTGTGTTTALTWDVNPAGFYKPYPSWQGPYYEPVPATLTTDILTLYVSNGIPNGATYPAPTFTYQWQNDGSPISGATASSYTRAATDTAGSIPSCVVTPSSGSPYTVTFPAWAAAPSIPEGAIVDTDFGTDFQLIYPSMTYGGSGATASWKPFVGYGSLATPDGGIVGAKSASFPKLWVRLGVIPAGTYSLLLHVPVGFDKDGITKAWNSAGSVGLYTSSSIIPENEYAGNLWAFEATATVEDDEGETVVSSQHLVVVDTTFTSDGVTDLHVGVRMDTSSGSTGPSDLHLSRLRVAALP